MPRFSHFQFHEIILAFKEPKSDIYVAKIGVENTKYLTPKTLRVFFKCQKRQLSYMKWTPELFSHNFMQLLNHFNLIIFGIAEC